MEAAGATEEEVAEGGERRNLAAEGGGRTDIVDGRAPPALLAGENDAEIEKNHPFMPEALGKFSLSPWRYLMSLKCPSKATVPPPHP